MLRLAAEQRARLAISLRVGLKMHAVGAQALRELRIVLDEASSARALHKVDQAGKAIFVARAVVAHEQNAGDVNSRKRLRELSFELCRGLAWKLQVEPAPRLDVSHDRGALAASWTLTMR